MTDLKQASLELVVPWREEGRWELPHELAAFLGEVAVLQPVLSPGGQRPILDRLSLGTAELTLPFRAIPTVRRFDLIVSWTLRIGVLYGILRRVSRRTHRGGRHVLCDFHIDPTRSDPSYRTRLKLLEAALPGIDFLFCTSNPERQLYSRRFGIPMDRIRFLPLAPAGHLFDGHARGDGDYVFAYGNSDRDFGTLIRAAAGLGIPLTLLSQRFQPHSPLPSNVRLIRHKIPYGELLHWIMGARLVVLPLRSPVVSAGQMAMMEAMALGAPLVVGRNPATLEYAVHGETARFYQPGDWKDLRAQLSLLLEDAHAARTMGAAARDAAHAFRHRQLQALLEGLRHALESDSPS